MKADRKTRSRTKDHGSAADAPAAGWTADAWFGPGGHRKSPREGLRVRVINPECGTDATEAARRDLLRACLEPSSRERTVYLTNAGFFGFSPDADGEVGWQPIADPTSLQRKISTLVDEALPKSALLAVGVDVTSHDQRQWWFQPGRGLVLEVKRRRSGWDASELEQRKVRLGAFTLLGFVCGEVYEWDKAQALSALHDVDVVAVSAHVEVNRQWKPRISPTLRRWAFQRRFQAISKKCGAALAHSHGPDYRYVRNCDDWFVHRDGKLFPGPRDGTPIVPPR